jgi:alpha-galactosidase
LNSSQLVTNEPATPIQGTPALTGTQTERFAWNPGALRLEFLAAAEHPVVMTGIEREGDTAGAPSQCSQPLVELIITGEGRARNSSRFTNTGVGSRLRYAGHDASSDNGVQMLEVYQVDPATGLQVTTTFSASADIAAARVTTASATKARSRSSWRW